MARATKKKRRLLYTRFVCVKTTTTRTAVKGKSCRRFHRIPSTPRSSCPAKETISRIPTASFAETNLPSRRGWYHTVPSRNNSPWTFLLSFKETNRQTIRRESYLRLFLPPLVGPVQIANQSSPRNAVRHATDSKWTCKFVFDWTSNPTVRHGYNVYRPLSLLDHPRSKTIAKKQSSGLSIRSPASLHRHLRLLWKTKKSWLCKTLKNACANDPTWPRRNPKRNFYRPFEAIKTNPLDCSGVSLNETLRRNFSGAWHVRVYL